MANVILLQSYFGSSMFISCWTCDGRKIDRDEAISLGLWSDELTRSHRRSNYVYEWFEIVPGTIIAVEIEDDYVDPPVFETITFTMGDRLPEPPNDPWKLYTYETTRDYLLLYAVDINGRLSRPGNGRLSFYPNSGTVVPHD